MTHIWGNLKWWNSIFSSYKEIDGELFLYLEDGSFRKMNDWQSDTSETRRHLDELSAGDRIKVATWEGYDEDKWFCDVEKKQ